MTHIFKRGSVTIELLCHPTMDRYFEWINNAYVRGPSYEQLILDGWAKQ